jgi:hypothetical protein
MECHKGTLLFWNVEIILSWLILSGTVAREFMGNGKSQKTDWTIWKRNNIIY